MPKITRLDRQIEREDLVESLDNALLPVGSIISLNPGYYSNSSNGSFVSVISGNNTSTVKSWLSDNYPNWWLCDGTIPNDSESPIWNNTSLKVPEMTANRFCRGATAAGSGQTTSNSKTLSKNTTMKVHAHNRGNLGLTGFNRNHDHNSNNSISLNHGHKTWAWSGGGNYQIYDSAVSNYNTTNFSNTGTNSLGHSHSNSTNENVSHAHTVSGNLGNAGSNGSFTTTPFYLTGFFIIRIK